MQDFGQELSNTETTSDTALTQQEIALENANQASIQGNSAKNTTLSQYYAKIKTVLDTSTLDEKHPQINLTLTSSENVGTAEFIISLTGTSCLQTENINLCAATRKQTFNSKTSPKILTLSQAGTKAGNTMLLIKICIPGSQDCITKTQRITIKE
ncbi:MAG: hypothetical protein LBG59_02605 [Candidatus Peribacteria bacterium]|jgi:hypothetical protein|nr:hypothetical protein [Candidatus Peribacteria bacterium]